ncbi:uncharacterized protein MONBRDRAFT_30473 [Monosiga brevicollis MX1]|uniref:Acetylornithine transaminase n=1 Tax=Monosiga brevicollis TaxID=81824 RepID=A9VE21_MONBE|nr:uncharacterized protein MONBRDRAFT_30473 [Monosiga brevicollis MX1]EDQ84248.1 predicted protein [Monosiga brevicollis MX1]|eukprot:XP_001750972.1 hypothetical protein [Monosiga brevicollis MX1]
MEISHEPQRLHAQRRALTSAALSVSYATSAPLVIIRGTGCYLIDHAGQAYLDTRNNVPHLGHCHPAVVRAVQQQVATLNTNSRYLHPTYNDLCQRLLTTLPPALRDQYVVFLVNSGSEANDLALRLARAHTGAQHVAVLDHAYHGNTTATLELSPYKFLHPRYSALGQPSPPTHTHVLPVPSAARPGDPTRADPLRPLRHLCDQYDRQLAALFVESGMSVASVILPPPHYFQAAFAAVRAAGGLCVCDEVQTGLGRTGAWYAFEWADVTPDIITLGKPMGNGMPLAAVLCHRDIGATLARGPEYFNTFGGNTVSCAAGLAVLETLEADNLLAHATRVGAHLMSCLCKLQASLAQQHPELPCHIGDVRGRGLFVGVEFVTHIQHPTPATQAASHLCTQLRLQHHILTSLDGPHDNVMVIKPPMCFGIREANQLVRALRAELLAMPVDLTGVAPTPT